MLISSVIYISALSSLLYFLIRNRFDFLLVFFLSTILYHWQIIGGTIITPPYFFKASEESVIIISLVLFIHTFITFLHDQIHKDRITFKDIKITKKYDLIAYILCFASLILTLRAINIVGIDFIYKGEYIQALNEQNINPIWLHYPASITLIYSVLAKNRILFILSLIPLLVYAYIGYRAELIMALVGCSTIYAFNSKLNSFKCIVIGLLAMILFTVFAVYKITYYEIKKDDVSAVEAFERRATYYGTNSEYLIKVLFYNEWGQVASNLSLSTENNLGKHYNLATVIIGSVPFVKRFTDISEDDVRFSRLIRKYANPGHSYGLGSTIWGEAFAAFNLVGVIVFGIIVSSAIAFLNNRFYHSNPIYLFSILFLCFLSFYIHRNDLSLVFAHLKNIIYLLLIVGFIFIVIHIFKFILLNAKNSTMK